MRIVQCHGCFDLLHIGHIRHLEAAKQAGDRLIVTVTPDAFVLHKGPGRPVFPLAQRMEAIAALRCVDRVESSEASTAAPAILRLRPTVFAKGPDWVGKVDPRELSAILEVGAEILFTNTEKFSSTALLQPREKHAPDVDAYLSALKGKYSAADVLGWLEKARALQVLVVGEKIIDEYRYCNVLGKAGKEPILAAQELRSERFDGGAVAVAAHVKACSDHVDYFTGNQTIKKTRFIESYPFQKLFETYDVDEGLPTCGENFFAPRDLTIIADYGHGLLTPQLRAELAKTPFLAINVQANAGNHGFNTISKYDRADFISISERELRLDARDQVAPVQRLMRRAANPRQATLLVTRGEQGCLAYQPDLKFCNAPALTATTIDRIGAGDAVFAITACCAAVGMPLDLLAFIAAVVGSMAVAIVGNARYIERDALHQAITTWLR